MRLLLLAVLAIVNGDELPPSCGRPVYCDSKLLHHVQLARLYNDSKTFVDLQMNNDEKTILTEFDKLLNQTQDNPSKKQLQDFVERYFNSTGELENWTPKDLNPDPNFLLKIKDPKLREFGRALNNIWPTLGRQVKPIVKEKPELFSMIPVDHGFIIPGGRFREIYYWDTYWIIEGLLICGMNDTVKGVISNLLELQRKFGHIPNGARCYYQERSQPPLLSAMMYLYIQTTKDIEFLKANIDALEDELDYWLDTQTIVFNANYREYTLLRYYTPSEGPRPESYVEDYWTAQSFPTKEEQTEFYIRIKSAAESGWDFSTRWFVNQKGKNSGNLTTVHPEQIAPVDLNAIFANALENVAYLQALTGNTRRGAHWACLAKQWKRTIKNVLWNNEDGIWYDYDIKYQKHRKYFYPSNIAPLWMKVVDPKFLQVKAQRILNYIKKTHSLDYPGGIPTSLIRSGEQWDFPNAWPPLVSMTINGLEEIQTRESSELAFQQAQNWVRANYKGFQTNKQMFEKYDVENPGTFGGGGEYEVQNGFGWTNGVVLEMLAKYGDRLTAEDN